MPTASQLRTPQLSSDTLLAEHWIRAAFPHPGGEVDADDVLADHAWPALRAVLHQVQVIDRVRPSRHPRHTSGSSTTIEVTFPAGFAPVDATGSPVIFTLSATSGWLNGATGCA